MGTIEKTVTIDAAAERVVAALTDGAQLEKWFPTKAVAEPRPGGKYHLTFIRPGEDTHVVDAEFTEVGPEKVSTSWPIEGLGDTGVDWILSQSGDGTTVRLVHNGIGEGGPWDQVREMMDPGWGMFVSNLKNYLEGGSDLRNG